MEQLKQAIDSGMHIKWVGYESDLVVRVVLRDKDGELYQLDVSMREDYSEEDFEDLLSSCADRPGSVTGTMWPRGDKLDTLRMASILGVNVGGSATPGTGHQFAGQTKCVMAYDIETDRSNLDSTSFGTLSQEILSIATYCSCGEWKLFSPIRGVEFDYVECSNSSGTAGQFILYVARHCPDWLVGYNCFSYDNPRIWYHAPDMFDQYYLEAVGGSRHSPSMWGFANIPGVYNADILSYLDKTARYRYENMKLETVARVHAAGTKMDFDTYQVEDNRKLFEYNVNDSKITMQLAINCGALEYMSEFAVTSAAPVIDAVRFNTGIAGACKIASHMLASRVRMDWSPCTDYKPLKGATVFDPILGTHDDVVCCDYSSMYPTIMVSSNVSFENTVRLKSNREEGMVDWDGDAVYVACFPGEVVCIDQSSKSKVADILVEDRKQRKRARDAGNEAKSNAIKVGSNSIYGLTGFSDSKIYSPNCSATVTASGRWCLTVASTIAEACGHRVVYGDTDSNFIQNVRGKSSAQQVVDIIERVLSFTPFGGMKMEVQDHFDRICFLGKKTYLGIRKDGRVMSKGMSKSRKDRLGICRSIGSELTPLMLDISLSNAVKRRVIADVVGTIVDMCRNGDLVLADVSKIVKRGGVNYYWYYGANGESTMMECDSASSTDKVEYSASKVCVSIRRELENVLASLGIGDINSIMSSQDMI